MTEFLAYFYLYIFKQFLTLYEGAVGTTSESAGRSAGRAT